MLRRLRIAIGLSLAAVLACLALLPRPVVPPPPVVVTPAPSPSVALDPDLPDPVAELIQGGASAISAGRDALFALELPPLIDELPGIVRAAYASELLRLHPATHGSAARFLSSYAAYTHAVGGALTNAGEALAGGAGYGAHTRLRRRVAARFAARYRQAMQAADDHLAEFTARLGAGVDPTYLVVRKSEFLVYLVGERANDVRAAFPIGVGALRGQKARRGDLRTPECPPRRGTRPGTPFFVGPLYRGDIVPNGGVITRGIGIDSGESEFGFLEKGWLIMFHGTPDAGSMGTRSSLGCLRMLPRHIEVLFEHVRQGARVVITP